ncbi:MAG TPA: RDD family protein [Thermoleophilaceae bacterium]
MAAAHADTAVPGTRPEYEGLVTRAIAFSLDAALINVVAIVVGAAIGLTLSVLSVPDALETALIAIGGAAYLLWSILYFVTFWSTTGQTPGNRLLGIRVCRADDGELLGPLRAAIRLAALTLCAIPLFAGFLPILVDDRRRGAHDMLVGSVVVGAPGPGEPPPP